MNNITLEKRKVKKIEKQKLFATYGFRRWQESRRSGVIMKNDLVYAFRKLSLMEKRLLLMAVACINPYEDERLKHFPVVVLRVKDVVEALGVKGENYYSLIKETLEKLLSRVVELKVSGNRHIRLCHWVDVADYDGEEILIRFSDELFPYLVFIREKYVVFSTDILLSFLRSAHTLSLYMLLKTREFMGTFEISYEELKDELGIEDKYPKFKDFKKRILLPAQKEFEEKADIRFEFTPLRRGRKIAYVRFKVEKNEKVLEKVKERQERERRKLVRDERERLLQKWSDLLSRHTFKRLTPEQVVFFLENSLVPPEEAFPLIVTADVDGNIVNPMGFLFSRLPILDPPSYMWLVSFGPESREARWWRRFSERLVVAETIAKRYGIELGEVPDPLTEKEAVKAISEIKARLAESIYKILPEEKKKRVDALVKNFARAVGGQTAEATKAFAVFQVENLPPLDLYAG